MFEFITKNLEGVNIVSNEGKTLLQRWFIVNTSILGIYLHKCTYPDTDPNLYHDHPWSWSCSIILSGYYIEECLDFNHPVKKKRSALSINFIHRDTFHRLSDISDHGVWTIYFRGKKVKKDGFLQRQSDGRWKHYLAEKSDFEYKERM